MAARRSKPPPHRRLKVYIAATVLGSIASGAALVLFSVLVFLLRVPVAQSGFLSLLAFGIGCLVAGFVAGAMKRQGGLVTGVKAALLYTLPVAVGGFIVVGFAAPEMDPMMAAMAGMPPGAPPPGGFGVQGGALAAMANVLNKVIIALLCGSVGGVLGVNKNRGF